MKRLTVSLLCVALAGCANQNDVSSGSLALLQPPVSKQETALWAFPELAAIRQDYASALLEVDVIKARKKPQITGTIRAGGASQNDDLLKESAQANLTLSSVVADSGQSNAAIDEARLRAEAIEAQHALRADAILAQMGNALIERRAAQQTIAVIDRNLALYKKRKPQIDQAAALGALSNSELLNIRTALNDVEGQRLEAQARVTRADALLQSRFLRNPDQRQTFEKAFSENRTRSLDGLPRWRDVASQLAVHAADQALESLLLSNKPTTVFTTRVSSPVDEETDPQLFVGFQFNFSLFDSGLQKAQARVAQSAVNRTHQDLLSVQNEIDLARSQLDVSLKANRSQRRVLRDRLALANEQISEFEKLLQAGRADIVTLSREIIARANTEIALIAIDAQDQIARLTYVQTIGGTCALFDVCDALEFRLLEADENI